MFRVRRINETGGSGWGLRVSWTGPVREHELFVWGLHKPFTAVGTHIGIHSWGQPWDSVNLYLALDGGGRLCEVEGLQTRAASLIRWCWYSYIRGAGPDFRRFYDLARQVRRIPGLIPAEQLFDWLEDQNIPEITRCLNYESTE